MGRKIKGKSQSKKVQARTTKKSGKKSGVNEKFSKNTKPIGKFTKKGLGSSGTRLETDPPIHEKSHTSQKITPEIPFSSGAALGETGNNPSKNGNDPKIKKKTKFRKRDHEIGFFRDKKKTEFDNGFIVNKGVKPWDWQITIPELVLNTEGKSPRAIDYSNIDKLIITEKVEIANTLKDLNLKNTTIHNLGGNPFSPAKRSGAKQNPDKVRRELREISWRTDKERKRFFVYPLTSEDTEVLIIADDDSIGHYLSQNLAHSLVSKNIRIMNSESNQPETLKDIVFDRKKAKNFSHKDNVFIGGSWFVGSQAEIGATLSSAFQIHNTLFDTFTEDIRGEKIPWTTRKVDGVKTQGFRQNYLRQFSTVSFNITDQEFAILGEVLRNEKENKIRIKATVQTDLGLREVVGESSIDVKDFTSKTFDVRIVEKDRNLLNVKNTDDTVLILADELGINTKQGELIIQRLSSEGLLTYPRTEFEGISQKEDITATKLADTWLSYLPEFKKERKAIVKGIDRIKLQSGEIQRSGILVLDKTTFKDNTIEKKVLNEIAKANILASLGAFEVTGEIQIINKETKEPIDMIDQSEVSIITRKPKSIGKVILVETERKEGLTDRELFRFMSKERKPTDTDSTLGTVSSRNRLIDRLKAWQLILENPKGELKTDDKAKLMILLIDKAVENNKQIPSLTTGEFTKFTKDQQDMVTDNPDLYMERKELLYQHLADLNKTLYNKEAHKEVELEFNDLSNQIDLSRKIKSDLRNDPVQIVS